jgi:hypothetical protein
MVPPANLFVPDTPHAYRPAGELPSARTQRAAAGEGARKEPEGGQSALADQMARAIAREAGAVGRYDVARRLFREREGELLGRVARGSARAFSELDQLRRGPLYFPPTRFEGAVDFGPGAPSHAMRPNGDFLLGVSNTGDDVSQHPAVRGAVPRVRHSLAASRDREAANAREPSTPGATPARTEVKDLTGGARENPPLQSSDPQKQREVRQHEKPRQQRRRQDPQRNPRAMTGQTQGQDDAGARPGGGRRKGGHSEPRGDRKAQARRPAAQAQQLQHGHSQSQSPFIGAGVAVEESEQGQRRRPTAGKPAGVWNGGGRLPEGKRFLSERKGLPGSTASSTVAGQRQQRDELTVATARPLPAGWAKVRSRSMMPSSAYYHDARSGQSQWDRPGTASSIVSTRTSYSTASERPASAATSSISSGSISTSYASAPTYQNQSRPRANTNGGSRRSSGGGRHKNTDVDPAVLATQQQVSAGGGSWSGLKLLPGASASHLQQQRRQQREHQRRQREQQRAERRRTR